MKVKSYSAEEHFVFSPGSVVVHFKLGVVHMSVSMTNIDSATDQVGSAKSCTKRCGWKRSLANRMKSLHKRQCFYFHLFCYRSRQMRWERSVRARDLTRRWRHLVVRNHIIISYGIMSHVRVVRLYHAMMSRAFSVLQLTVWARRLLWGHQQWRLHLRLHRTVPGTHVCHTWELIFTCTCTSSSKTPTVG